MTRKECLDKAAECVLRDRQKQYGKPEDCFETIAMMWSAYLGKPIQGWDVATMMALLKIARIKANPAHADNWCDLAGYAACGAECRQKFEAEMKKTVEDAFETFPHLKPKAEGGCFQNGNDHSPEASAEPDFKSGDRVQFKEHLGVKGWADARYEREHPSGYGHIVYAEGFGRIAVEPENLRPAPKADEEPEFQRGDKVEVQMVPDSSTWASAVITAVYRDKDSCEWRYCADFEDGWAHVVVPSARVRPVSGLKAEGVEELVQKDAPQTKEELYQRIVDCNPATFHTPSYAEEQLEHHSRLQSHKPTGEELAEMAEEEEKHG